MTRKPEKMEGEGLSNDQPFIFGKVTGFNQACDDWEAYIAEHYIPKQSLPSAIDIEEGLRSVRKYINMSGGFMMKLDKAINFISNYNKVNEKK